MSTFDVKSAAALAPKIALHDVIFAGVEATVLAPFLLNDGDSFGFDLPKTDVRWMRQENEIRVVLPYQVQIVHLRDAARTPVVRLRVLLRVDYLLASDATPTDEEISNYVGISAFMHSWPYLRSEVEGLTTKLRLPPLVLPVMLSGQASALVTVSRMEEPPPELVIGLKGEPASGHLAEPSDEPSEQRP